MVLSKDNVCASPRYSPNPCKKGSYNPKTKKCDEAPCKPGFRRIDGPCVALDCKAGWKVDETGHKCIKSTIICVGKTYYDIKTQSCKPYDHKCPDGFKMVRIHKKPDMINAFKNAIANKTKPVKKAFNVIKGLTMKNKIAKIPRVFRNRNLQAMKSQKVKVGKKLDNPIKNCSPGTK